MVVLILASLPVSILEPSIASYALRKTACDNEEKFSVALRYIERNFYIDDHFVLTNSLEIVQKILQVLRYVLSKGCFSLTKWISSSPELLNLLEPKIRLHSENAPPQHQKDLVSCTINCFGLFISRRGKPNKFVSDYGKSFVGSNDALKPCIKDFKESKLFAAKLHNKNKVID